METHKNLASVDICIYKTLLIFFLTVLFFILLKKKLIANYFIYLQ